MAPIKKRYDELVRVGESLIFKFKKKDFPSKQASIEKTLYNLHLVEVKQLMGKMEVIHTGPFMHELT